MRQRRVQQKSQIAWLWVVLLLILTAGAAGYRGWLGPGAPVADHLPAHAAISDGEPAADPTPVANPVPAEPAPAPEPEPEAEPQPLPEPEPETEPAPPPVTVQVEPAAIGQGELALVRVANAPGLAEGELAGGGPLRFFRTADGWQVALLGAPSDARPGLHEVRVRWSGGEWRGQVEITRVAFDESRITVTEQKASTMTDPRVREQQARVRALRSQGQPEPLWEGEFALPTEGRFTTEFGEIRYVNGEYRGQHSGLDIAAPEGTPVRAPNHGQVLLAEYLVLTGHTILIDHGGGLYTGYAHLSALAVEPGQTVRKGDLIGEVGSTGLSTGPHLHWTVTVGNTFINPRLVAGQRLLDR